MTTNFDTDSSTQTIAAAWACSPLGQPEREVRYGFAPTGTTESVTVKPTSDRKRAPLVAALASGVIAGATLGVMLFDYTDATRPTVVVPRSEGRLPGPPSALPTETRPAPDTAPSPNPVVSEQLPPSLPLQAGSPPRTSAHRRSALRVTPRSSSTSRSRSSRHCRRCRRTTPTIPNHRSRNRPSWTIRPSNSRNRPSPYRIRTRRRSWRTYRWPRRPG